MIGRQVVNRASALSADDVIDTLDCLIALSASERLLRRRISARDVGAAEAPSIRRSQVMQAITTVGLDIAKSVFQVHGVDAHGNVIFRR